METYNDTDRYSMGYRIALVTSISVTCILSMIGSGAIIFTYAAFSELRTTVRYLLLNISIADFINAATNMIGALYSLHFLNHPETRDPNDPICVTQAAIGLFGYDASILWTMIFIAYIYLLLACWRPKPLMNIIFLTVISVVTWTIPLSIVIVFAVKEYFGFQPDYSPAFCTVDIYSRSQIYKALIGYEVILYSSFLVLPILSVIFLVHLGCIKRRQFSIGNNVSQFSRVVRSTELKLVFVPLIFLLMYIWRVILDITTFYLPSRYTNEFRDKNADLAFIFLTGVGDSAQGFVNGILFILFTQTVRKRLINSCFNAFCCCCRRLVDKPNRIVSHDIQSKSSDFSYRSKRSQRSHSGPLHDSLMAEEEDSDNTDMSAGMKLNTSLSNFSADTDIPYEEHKETYHTQTI